MAEKAVIVDEKLPDQAWTTGRIKKVMQAMDKGLSAEEAYFLVTGKRVMHRNTKSDLKKKHDKWLLSRPQLQKLASNAVRDTLKMMPVETESVETCPGCKAGQDKPSCKVCSGTGVLKTVIHPSYTNRLAAAAMVVDRVDPVVRQSMNLNVNKTFIEVDLVKYQ
jgi:hypothetical protein